MCWSGEASFTVASVGAVVTGHIKPLDINQDVI